MLITTKKHQQSLLRMQNFYTEQKDACAVKHDAALATKETLVQELREKELLLLGQNKVLQLEVAELKERLCGKPERIIKSLEDVEALITLGKKHQTDLLEVEGHRVLISRHTASHTEDSKPAKTQEEQDEEDLFWSTKP